ncbi:MAG: hypothetical protein U0892_19210 [Pirellulales bacterium]
MEAAQDRIEQLRTESLAIEVKKGEIATLPADQHAAKQAEIDEINKGMVDIETKRSAGTVRSSAHHRSLRRQEKLLDARAAWHRCTCKPIIRGKPSPSVFFAQAMPTKSVGSAMRLPWRAWLRQDDRNCGMAEQGAIRRQLTSRWSRLPLADAPDT